MAVHVGFVVDKVALGKVFSKYFSPLSEFVFRKWPISLV
jgi:hypothetical protein